MELVPHPSSLPVDLDLYEMITPMLEVSLGIYFNTNYYVANRDNCKKGTQNVFYQRFVYDLISMFGLNLFYIDIKTLEFLVRRVYASISYNFQGQIKLRRLQDIEPSFTEDEFKSVIKK
jgi:hypothetical protein